MLSQLLIPFVAQLVGFHCSPYSATVLLSIPPKQKLTVKADLIFEEYSKNLPIICHFFFPTLFNSVVIVFIYIDVHAVGLDFQQKLVLLKDSNSDVHRKHGHKQPSLFPPPEEVCVIEDEDEITSYARAGKICNLMKSKIENSSM